MEMLKHSISLVLLLTLQNHGGVYTQHLLTLIAWPQQHRHAFNTVLRTNNRISAYTALTS